MFEIKGKVIQPFAMQRWLRTVIEQIRRIKNMNLQKEARYWIMPDVHAGKGCTIGTTMTIVDKAVPNVVGVDIGCGMYTVKLRDNEIDMKKVRRSGS
ncbi:MAG: RtcB family protein [[Clostridium] scindens]